MAGGATVEAVAEHYDAFPFPHPRADLGGAPQPYNLAPDAAVWVAGCGTLQAARWAKAHPLATFVASDVSAATIEVARGLASRHGLVNVEFRCENIADVDYDSDFDLVLSTGVVHHMPHPAQGLRAIARSLRPDGEALIMVYRRSIRRELGPIKRVVEERNTTSRGTPAQRFEIAGSVLRERTDPLATLLRRLSRPTPTVVADALLNPIEHHYEPDEIPKLLEGTGLAFERWADPLRPPTSHPEAQIEFFARLHDGDVPVDVRQEQTKEQT